MPLDPNGTPIAGTGTATPSDEGTAAQTPATPPAPTARQENALLDVLSSFRTELVDMRREFRNRFGGKPDGTAATASTPATSGNTAAPAPVWDSRADLAFRDAIEEAGVTVSVPQRKMLEKLYRAESDVANPVTWVREQTELLGWRKAIQAGLSTPASTPTAAAATTPVKPPATPAPTGTAADGNQLPDDPALLPQSVIDAMTPEQARAHYERWKQRQGVFRHPYAAARDAEARTGQDLAHAAAVLRQVLAGKK